MQNDDESARRAALAWLARQLAWEQRLMVLRGLERPPRKQRPAA